MSADEGLAEKIQLLVAEEIRKAAKERVGEGERFGVIGDAYGADANFATARSTRLSILAGVLVGLGLAFGGWQLAASSDSSIRPGVWAASAALVASVPAWWLADRYRREASENRRLQRHLETVEPFLNGFATDRQDEIRLLLAQRLFARTSEDNDPFDRPVWPTELLDDVDSESPTVELGNDPGET